MWLPHLYKLRCVYGKCCAGATVVGRKCGMGATLLRENCCAGATLCGAGTRNGGRKVRDVEGEDGGGGCADGAVRSGDVPGRPGDGRERELRLCCSPLAVRLLYVEIVVVYDGLSASLAHIFASLCGVALGFAHA